MVLKKWFPNYKFLTVGIQLKKQKLPITFETIIKLLKPDWFQGFPDGSLGKVSAYNAGNTGDVGLIPGLGRSSGKGNYNLLQYSCPQNPMDSPWATVHGVAKSQTWLSDWTTRLNPR